MAPTVGIIANPVSARDIRRVIANATALQITDRANIVLRVLACLKAAGVGQVVMMPENGGIRHHVHRGLERSRNLGEHEFPDLAYLDMAITGTVDDTIRAADLMRQKKIDAIVVLGGDGTHRAVVSRSGDVPIAGISTGTNNAFPEHREPTITGLAVGLAVTGKVPPAIAFSPNKKLSVRINDNAAEIALVDVALVTERVVGARALWRTETFRELFVTFADPECIGMSAIAGLLEPVKRSEPQGLHVLLAPPDEAELKLSVPIAPGYMREIGIVSWQRLKPGKAYGPQIQAGTIALDGERELSFSEHDRVSVALEENAFRTVNVAAVMNYAACHGLMRRAGIVEKKVSMGG
ncbi:ATP-NAD kinase family protein [Taklimakanibacter deserti]|uniref:ATP-NAD kinase family protein n=1 Tax=Taklimakanibacter deserti TaxID=2267839 RepID=UPI000E6560A2